MAEIALGVTASQSSLLLEPSKFGFHTLATPSASLRLHLPPTPSRLLISSPKPKQHNFVFAAKVVSSDSIATSSSSSTIITDNVDLSTEGIEIELDTGGGGNDGYKDTSGGGGGGGGGDGGGKNEGEGGSADESGCKKTMALSMSQKLTLGYAALVGMGGVMGYMKSGSQKSLLAGGISASVLYYVYTQLPANPVYASSIGLGISAALMGVMGSRFLKSKKIFPAGVVSLVSLIMTGGYLHGILRRLGLSIGKQIPTFSKATGQEQELNPVTPVALFCRHQSSLRLKGKESQQRWVRRGAGIRLTLPERFYKQVQGIRTMVCGSEPANQPHLETGYGRINEQRKHPVIDPGTGNHPLGSL
ncbi:unnamed protein product [Dovyalis caffra]|uniref:Uncharacterized protein n=1 Tax=Dovyalis caffra TaxID=77055 RepID=A0AAV1SJE2_9ROSI|nr:unnamed protein product [Dovyalis caffra]